MDLSSYFIPARDSRCSTSRCCSACTSSYLAAIRVCASRSNRSSVSTGTLTVILARTFLEGQGQLRRFAPLQESGGPGERGVGQNPDVVKLAHALISRIPRWALAEVRFYTGVPSQSQNADWHGFWNNKLRHLSRQRVTAYRQELSKRGQEKGLDVRLAAELVQATYEQLYEVEALVAAAPSYPVRMAMRIMLRTGLRVGECLSLRSADLRLGRLPRPEFLELHHGPPGGWPRGPGKITQE